MQVIRKQNIDDFLNCKTIAIAGASRNEKSFSAEVAKHLEKLGYQLYLINPHFEAEDNKVKTIQDLPADVNNILILTPKDQTESVLKDAISKGIKNSWIQQMADSPAALKLGLESQINLVYGHCIFMFTQPEGIHKFHYNIKKFFGGIPK